MEKTIFTVVSGNSHYVKFAINLFRSLIWQNGNSDFKYVLVTDLSVELPNDLNSVKVIQTPIKTFNGGVSFKLWLDELARSPHSLFIDSDCLCFGNMQPVFERFRGKPVSVVGFDVSRGEWCGPKTEDICKTFRLKSIPRFNGGLYYIEKGAEAGRVFEKARNLASEYDRLGFGRHRGSFNEEPLISIAMATYNQSVVLDDGTIMSDTASCITGYEIDVIKGTCRLTNPKPEQPRNKWWYSFRHYSPAIVHFGGEVSGYRYRREVLKLRLASDLGLPVVVSRFIAWVVVSVPGASWEFVKSKLRPVRNKLRRRDADHLKEI